MKIGLQLTQSEWTMITEALRYTDLPSRRALAAQIDHDIDEFQEALEFDADHAFDDEEG